MALSEKEKWWLEEHREEIVEYLAPRETVKKLRNQFPELFDGRDVDDIILKHVTPREQSEALLDLLRSRPREALQAFRHVLSSLTPHLASQLWPVTRRLLWLCPSPAHAAVVVHLLKRFTRTEFVEPQDGGPVWLLRRSSGGALGAEGALLTLAFPHRPGMFHEMLPDVLREKADIVVMTGSCEALVPGLSAGQAVVPLSLGEGGSTTVCRAAERVRDHQNTLRTRLEQAPWKKDVHQMYTDSSYMDYCSVWLARLYVEMTDPSGGNSGWVESQGVVRLEGGGVACRIPEWGSGELARHLLGERRTWRVDPTSPLGIAPTPAITSRITQKIHNFDSFPSRLETTPPCVPVFNPLSTGTGKDGEISSPEAAQFFKTCSAKLPADSQWLACLSLCHDIHSDNLELSTHTAVTMAIEVLQMLMSFFG